MTRHLVLRRPVIAENCESHGDAGGSVTPASATSEAIVERHTFQSPAFAAGGSQPEHVPDASRGSATVRVPSDGGVQDVAPYYP